MSSRKEDKQFVRFVRVEEWHSKKKSPEEDCSPNAVIIKMWQEIWFGLNFMSHVCGVPYIHFCAQCIFFVVPKPHSINTINISQLLPHDFSHNLWPVLNFIFKNSGVRDKNKQSWKRSGWNYLLPASRILPQIIWNMGHALLTLILNDLTMDLLGPRYNPYHIRTLTSFDLALDF